MAAGINSGAAPAVLGSLRRWPAQWWIGLAILLTMLLHLLYLQGPPLSDEGGFAMVAHWWGRGGGGLYGSQWVDRPPGLITAFWLANLLGSHGVRLLAAVVASGFVLFAAWAGYAASGRRAAVWAAWAGFFLVNAPLTETYALNGELLAATWTMLAVAAGVHAIGGESARWSRLLLGTLAGASASAAVLTKQNFIDAGVFLVVLVIAEGWRRRRHEEGRRWHDVAALGGATIAGAASVLLLGALWAIAHRGLATMVYALYGFRVDASAVMAHWSSAAPEGRALGLVAIAVGSGIGSLALVLLISGARHLRSRAPLPMALAAAAAVELAGVVLGGNYWPHYLIGLAPMLALGAGVLAAEPAGRWVRVFVALPVVVTLGLSPAAAVEVTEANAVSVTGRWLAQASHPGDSLVVLYSHANLIDGSGLRPAYPYAWSLPVRTLDPDLRVLTAVLDDPNRSPTWVVGWDDFRAWGLDGDAQVERALAANYVEAGVVCGHQIWLHRGLARDTSVVSCPAE